MSAPTEILVCPPPLRAEAIKLVLRDLTPEQQVATVASTARLPEKSLDGLDALFVAICQRQITAAVWAQPQPGRTATLWPPQFAGESDTDVASELIEAATRRTGESDAAMLQAVIEPTDTFTPNLLLSAGFAHVAKLLYLEWLPKHFERSMRPVPQFEPYHSGLRESLKQVIGQTYIGSLDCPKLDHLRSLDDVLEGYQATGDFDPTMWMLVRAEGHDVGALLLAWFAQTQQAELIYMGIVPAARGQGMGAALLSQAQALAIERRAEKLLLAVDAANIPARKLYQRAGFREWSQRNVYMRAFSGGV
ncbi:MAG: GNAT family N-acetyltransferase [Pirellulales bacterium]